MNVDIKMEAMQSDFAQLRVIPLMPFGMRRDR
jgi:hypothetical protein